MSVISGYFDTVDFSKVRTALPPELIFLCGGNDDPDNNNFRPKLKIALEEREHNVVLAEKAMDWQGGQEFAKDLLELEKYFAALVSLIPLVCESFGSIAELGAFVSNEAIRNKLHIIIKEKYYSGNESSSFIRYGPIQNFEDNVGRRAYCIDDDNPENDIADVCEDIAQCRPRTSKCDLSKGYFRILLLIDIINTLIVAEEKEVRKIFFETLDTAEQKVNDDRKLFNEMLFVLQSLRLIKKRTKGSKTYFLSVRQDYYLEYRAKGAANYTRITTIRKKILNEIYDAREETKISILEEEKKKSDIIWLQKAFPLKEKDIQTLLETAPLQYKVYKIPKRSGGTRVIAQPTSQLKNLQRIDIEELSADFPIHDCAKAYIKYKNGILENALAHKDNCYFYKFDFENFFPSIKAKDFNSFLDKAGYSLKDRIKYIKTFFRFDKSSGKQKTRNIYRKLKDKNFNRNDNPELLTLMTTVFAEEFQLSVGAPSSPTISNILLYRFDTAVHRWANLYGIVYTRFADDITFSSSKKYEIKFIEDALLDVISDIEEPNLILKKEKEKFCSFKERVTITGLNITPEHKISIGRDKKKKISAMIHHFSLGKLSKLNTNKLRGWLSYCKAVENEFVKSMEVKYSAEVIKKIMHRQGLF
ncbi:MAG: retron St85 family RNA-directed DNA polymerase [Methyloligellaceae bacterium]